MFEIPHERIIALFENLDLNRPGMEEVRQPVERKNWDKACHALLDYYRHSDTVSWLRKSLPAVGEQTDSTADTILSDVLTQYTISGKVPRLGNGRLDWNYQGPNNDREWCLAVNRHFHLKFLLDAYFRTGIRKYVSGIDAQLIDWILSNPYPAKKHVTDPWRGLEVFHRLKFWAPIFYNLQHEPALSDEARLLLLSSIPEHAHYLLNFHAETGNWITMEMNGLAIAAVCWQEFKDSPKWLDYAITHIVQTIDDQVYPDGVQKELTSHYHRCALTNFEEFAALLEKAGRPLSVAFNQRLQAMWNYLAYSLRPDGSSPLNNDSDRDYNRDRIRAAAQRFNRPDWLWIASNGTDGSKPDTAPSCVFPWAGQAIMRNGWNADAHWAFFDIGPWGTGHQHSDMLHLSIAAFGRDILVDGGRYTYVNNAWRQFFRNSAAHNVILVEGNSQQPGPRETLTPVADEDVIFQPEFDFARGKFTNGFLNIDSPVTHTRAVLYVRYRFWIVVDRIESETPKNIQAIWNYHPHCAVQIENQSVTSADTGAGNLRIIPVSPLNWNIKLVRGQTEPEILGWWSERYNVKEPCTTAVYQSRIDSTQIFAWVLLPAKGDVPRIRVQLVSAHSDAMELFIHDEQQAAIQITIPLDAGKPAMRM
ncbi:alginate lyase family protein [candidate division KSB1 bacterium]|nr:alginate lyase family protein [candidate division KSB1 bacterium]